MKKHLVTLLSAFLAASALAGCGSSSADTTPAASTEPETTVETAAEPADAAAYENCTLKFDWWGGDSRHEATLAAIAAFEEAYPGITIETNYGAWSDWETAKAAEYISGNNPDVQQTNFDWIGKYDKGGNTYLDLNTVSDVLDLSQWSATELETCSDENGGIAGLPVSITGRTFYWDKTTFDAAGIDTPKTLEDLLAAGPVFQEKLGDNYYPLVIGEYDRAILMAFYLQAKTGKPILAEDNTLTVTEADLQEGFEFIKSLEDAHAIPTEQYILGEGADSMDKSSRFINGEYAGIFEWDSSPKKYLSALEGTGNELVVGNVFPELQSYQKVSLMFSISAKTAHPKEAALFLNFLLNEKDGIEIMGTERGVPSSKVAFSTLDSEGAIDWATSEAHNAVLDSNPIYWNPLFDNSALKGDSPALYTDLFDQYSYGMITSEQAAAQLYAGYQSVLASN
ncbi:MAG: carbohydrate ABC transporter substrate-binding protein [Solobacterium sp.]|nr:carbohydrate ABC transporter substrate-binding protein [Solobacterium sp.]